MVVRRSLGGVVLAALITLPLAGAAMGLFGNGPATRMTLTDASHVTNPIMVQSLSINGQAYGPFPHLASTDWENPRGGNRTLTGLRPPVEEGSAIVVQADWVEVYSNRAYSARIVVPEGKITVKKTADLTAYVTIVFGRDGHLAVSTDTGPDPTSGEYNGTVVAEVCGEWNAAADVDFRTRPEADVDIKWVYEQEDKRKSLPRLETPCVQGET